MRYSFDTSVILNPWRRHYPRETFPSLWSKLDELIDADDIIASVEVLEELKRKDDEVHQWALKRRQMFIPLYPDIQQSVINILAKHPRLVDNRKNRSGADPFVIALTQVENCAVVTYETPSHSPNRPRIPDVCNEMEVRCINMTALFREQGWAL